MSLRIDRVRYLVVGMQRSGTTVTYYGLRDHPHASGPGPDIRVDPLFSRGLGALAVQQGSYRERCDGALGLFDGVASIGANDRTTAIGMKVALESEREALHLRQSLCEYYPDVRVVLVVREDLTAQFGSLVRARKTGVWHAWRGNENRGDARIRVDPTEFARYVDESQAILAQLRTLLHTHTARELSYEREILASSYREDLLRFLDLDPALAPSVPMSKVAPPPSEFLENHDELVAIQRAAVAPSEAEIEARAWARAKEIAASEPPTFLVERAWSRLSRGDADSARSDFRMALERFDGVRRGAEVMARVSALRGALGDRDLPEAGVVALAEAEVEWGEGLRFRLARAQLRLALADAGGARDDLDFVFARRGDLEPGELRRAESVAAELERTRAP